MKDGIDNILEDYYHNKIDLLEVRKQLLILYNINRRNDLLNAFSWISTIGEQFFDTCKSLDDLVDSYLKTNYK